jgi:hypothetical protein
MYHKCILAVYLCFLPSIVVASYSDGFWAFVVIFFSLPFVLIGFIATIVLCKKGRFIKNKGFLMQYSFSWLFSFVLASLICKEEIFYGVAAYSIFTLLIIGPAIIQYNTSISHD